MPETDVSPHNPYEYETVEVLDSSIAYIDTGGNTDDTAIFIHGNPTTSYLWRNVIPHLEDDVRCLAPDLIGFGRSGGMPSGTYRFPENIEYMDAWFDAVAPEGDITFVVQDWGAALAFNWTRQHPDRVKGLCYGEAMVQPRRWSDLPEDYREQFQWFRTEEGFESACERDYFVEEVLPNGVLRGLDETALDEYRTRHNHSDGAVPSVQWPVEIPFDGEPADCHRIVQDYADFLEHSDLPKLFVNTTEGHALIGRNREFCQGWPNQEEILLDAAHYYPEDCPNELGRAVADWYNRLN